MGIHSSAAESPELYNEMISTPLLRREIKDFSATDLVHRLLVMCHGTSDATLAPNSDQEEIAAANFAALKEEVVLQVVRGKECA